MNLLQGLHNLKLNEQLGKRLLVVSCEDGMFSKVLKYCRVGFFTNERFCHSTCISKRTHKVAAKNMTSFSKYNGNAY